MEREFLKAFAKIAIAVTIVLTVLCIAVGIAILMYPQMFLQILLYAVGALFVFIGIVLLISLIRSCFGR